MSEQPKVITTVYATSVPVEPLPAVIVDNNRENINFSENMITTYSLGKTVKCLSIIDIVFSFIYALYNMYFFIPILIAFTGYYGAKKYQTCPTLTYFIYNFLGNLVRIGYSIYLFSNISSDQRSDFTFSFIFSIFCGFLGLYIAKIIHKFYTYMNKLTIDEINQLRLMRYYTNSRIIVW